MFSVFFGTILHWGEEMLDHRAPHPTCKQDPHGPGFWLASGTARGEMPFPAAPQQMAQEQGIVGLLCHSQFSRTHPAAFLETDQVIFWHGAY